MWSRVRSSASLSGFSPLVWLSVLLFLSTVMPLHADVGVIVETPTGLLGFLSNVGHVSVWISHGCLDDQGEVRFCEDTQGIVLTSTAYWSNPGAAAIPAELFFLGSGPGSAGRGATAWTQNLAGAYPNVEPTVGRKYLGRVWLRGMRVLTFKTSAEEDRRVLEKVEAQRQAYRYSYSRRNCAFYAEQVLKLYLGEDFHANRILEFGIVTPRSLERALLHHLNLDSAASFHTIYFKGSRIHSWRQPPRNICESAIFDPKYALPLAFYQPYLYGGFAVCYGITRFTEAVRHSPARSVVSSSIADPPRTHPASQGNTETQNLDSHLAAFEMLTGKFPVTSPWATPLTSSLEPSDGSQGHEE